MIGLVMAALASVTAPAAGQQAALKLPPPDLRALLPLAAPPADKPQIPLPPVALPELPQSLPELPAPPLVSDLGHRPVLVMPPPRLLACNPLGTVLGVASELVECGRARYQRGELEEARKAFQGAVQGSSDRLVLREARYWLAETLLRLKRPDEVERVLLPVAQDDPRSDFGIYAAQQLGWVTLANNEAARALGYFDEVLKAGGSRDLMAHARHGRAMALYGLRRYAEAREEWAALLNIGGFLPASAPPPVVTEANFWLGDTLGRLGEYRGAVARLQAFADAGPQLLIENGLFRLGWWSRPAGRPLEAVKTLRAFLGAYPRAPEAIWARVGLALALLDLDDYPGALEDARQLDGLDKKGTLALPTLLTMRRWTTEKNRANEARALDELLLAKTLDPVTHAWVLMVGAELARQSGQAAESHDRFELVRKAPRVPAYGYYAALRLAQIDFDAREFGRAKDACQQLLGEPLPAEYRAAALVLAGEAAYWAHDYEGARGFYTWFVSDLPGHPQAPQIGLALGWAEFRRNQLDAARQRWMTFTREAPLDARVPETLLLAAELAARAGDLPASRALFDQVLAKFPSTEHADMAILNRAILTINAGRAREALPDLARIEARAPTSPYLGRIREAKGIALLAAGRANDARRDFRAALGQGEDAAAHVGLGVIAFDGAQWQEAAREFTEARDGGSAAAAEAAEYGLAAVAFNQGKNAEFKQLAVPILARPDDARITPNVLTGLVAVAAEEKRWTEARELTLRLVRQYPNHDGAVASVSRLAAATGKSGEWPLARDMYQMLAARYPGSAGTLTGRVVFAEALLRTGAAPEARRELEAFVKDAAGDPQMQRALVLLAEAREATGDRQAALEAYTRYATDNPTTKDTPTVLLGAGRLLQTEGKWDEARGFLERALAAGDAPVVAEAAYRMGEGLQSTGHDEEAIDAFLTAAYVAPDSAWARRSLLGAGQSFTTLKEKDAAVIVYRKLLAASRVEPDLVAAARRGLRALGAN